MFRSTTTKHWTRFINVDGQSRELVDSVGFVVRHADGVQDAIAAALLDYPSAEIRVVDDEDVSYMTPPDITLAARDEVWDEVIEAVSAAWPGEEPQWSESPIELITRLINERDDYAIDANNAEDKLAELYRLRPREEWHEDLGDVLIELANK